MAKSETIARIPAACNDEAAAVLFMEDQRWSGTPCCPECGSTKVYAMTGRDGKRNKNYRWRCRDCGVMYTVRTGTVMAESRIPMRHWVYAFWRACTSKKGVSALEIQRQTGLSYKSALFMMHRIRFAMFPGGDGPKLDGTVECDETYVGGKPRYRLPRTPDMKGNPFNNYATRKDRKTMVFAAIQRDGQARVRVVPDVNVHNLPAAVRAHVDQSARLMTDENPKYRAVGREMAGGHESVNHAKLEYARGDAHCNSCESFFANLKRGIHGVYHHVSRKHLGRYLAEFEFRYNHRELEDGDRVIAAIRGADGKRLVYEQPSDAA